MRLALVILIAFTLGCGKKQDEPKVSVADSLQVKTEAPKQPVQDSLKADGSPSPEESSKPIAPELRTPRRADHPIKNKRWKLVQIAGQRVNVTEDFDSDPYLTFAMLSDKLRGSGGCNRFGATYSLEGEKLAIIGMAATKKHCEKVMPVEEPFLRELATVNGYNVVGDALWLLRDGSKILKFEAVYTN